MGNSFSNGKQTKSLKLPICKTKQLLIYGYCRNTDYIVPKNIIELCIGFYSTSKELIIFVSQVSNNMQAPKELLIANFTDKVVRKLDINQKDLLPYTTYQGWCYIPNISSMIECEWDINKSYDGIIGEYVNRNDNGAVSSKHPAIYFIETSSKIKNDIITPKAVISKYDNIHQTNISNHYLFCDAKHGVLYESGGDLYQLKFKDINIKTNFFKFNPLKSDTKTALNADFVSMIYLRRYQKVFGMQCSRGFNGNNAKCGLFDFDEFKWDQLKGFEFKVDVNKNKSKHDNMLDIDPWPLQMDEIGDHFNAALCQNELNQNEVYMLSNHGHTAKYDINQNKWITVNVDKKIELKNSSSSYRTHEIWSDNDPNLLCYAYCDPLQYICWPNGFGYIDLRKPSNGWNKMDLQFLKLNDKQVFYFS